MALTLSLPPAANVARLLGGLRRLRGGSDDADPADAPAAGMPEPSDMAETAEAPEPAGPASDRMARVLSHLRAWWAGDVLEGEAAGEAGADAATGAPESEAATPAPAAWNEHRQEVVENLWGKGFSSPGEADHVMALIKPLGLDRKQSVLDIGVGLGGSTRVIANETGAWVTGLEADAAMVKAGMEVSVMAGMAKRAPIHLFTPPRLEIRDRCMDVVVSKESLYGMPHKEILFQEMYRVLKPVGQILFTDYMLPGEGGGSAMLEAWRAGESPAPDPWTVERTVNLLREMRLDVRIAEDMTGQLKHLVIQGWLQLLRQLTPGKVPHPMAVALITEAEFWVRRLALLESHDLRCYRIYAMKREAVYK